MTDPATERRSAAMGLVLAMVQEAKEDKARWEATPDPGYAEWRKSELRKAALGEAGERIELGEFLYNQLREGARSFEELDRKAEELLTAAQAASTAWRAVSGARDLWRRLSATRAFPKVMIEPAEESDAKKLEREVIEERDARAADGVLPSRDDARAAEELGLKLETDS